MNNERTCVASPSNDGPGPLPEPAMLHGPDEDYYTGEQMRTYALQELATERERLRPLLRGIGECAEAYFALPSEVMQRFNDELFWINQDSTCGTNVKLNRT